MTYNDIFISPLGHVCKYFIYINEMSCLVVLEEDFSSLNFNECHESFSFRILSFEGRTQALRVQLPC